MDKFNELTFGFAPIAERKSTLTQNDIRFRKNTLDFISWNPNARWNSSRFDKVLSSGVLNGTVDREFQNAHKKEITSIAFSSDGSMIATGGDDKKVKLWDSSSFIEIPVFKRKVEKSPKKKNGKKNRYSVKGNLQLFSLIFAC